MTAILASINFNSILLALIAASIGGVWVALIKRQPALKKIAADREANLLSERAKEMKDMREELDGLRASLELTQEELRIVRHDLANANQSLDLFIALIEANPERAAEHAARVKAHRDAAVEAIRNEKTALTQARLAHIRKPRAEDTE